MSKHDPLDTLINLATDDRDAASRLLGKLHAEHHESEQQLEVLTEYRREYQKRFNEKMALGMSMAALHNYQRFIAALDAAIAQQRTTLSESADRVQDGKHHWQSKQRRLKSFDVLAMRRRTAAELAEARREQRQNDEFASRSSSTLGHLS